MTRDGTGLALVLSVREGMKQLRRVFLLAGKPKERKGMCSEVPEAVGAPHFVILSLLA